MSGAASKAHSYDYLPLCDALQLPVGATQCHLYGVVVECSYPRPTKGTDYVVNLKVVDPSLAPGQAVELQLFGSEHELPRSRQDRDLVGDIVRLHRVKVTSYNNKPSFVVKLNKPSSFAIFSSVEGADAPYQKSSVTFSFDALDASKLATLRAMSRRLQGSPSAHALQFAGESLKYLKSIVALRPGGGRFDLLCLVLAVEWGGPGTALVLHCWDGTDAHPFHREQCCTTEGGPPETQLIVRELPLSAALAALPGPSTPGASQPWRSQAFLGGVPPLGTCMPVVVMPPVHGRPELASAQLPQPGAWVKLRNLGVLLARGQLQGAYTGESKWALAHAPAPAELVLNAEKRLQEGHLAFWAKRGRAAQAACLTRIPSHCVEHVPCSSLREVIARPAPHKFRCLVRVTAMTPQQPHRLAHPRGPLDAAQAQSAAQVGDDCAARQAQCAGESHLYAFLLSLEDSTAQLQALLYGDHAAKFMHGYPAAAREAGTAETGMLAAKLARLSPPPGSNTADETGVWVHVILESHVDADFLPQGLSAQQQRDVEAVKRVCVVDTVLLS